MNLPDELKLIAQKTFLRKKSLTIYFLLLLLLALLCYWKYWGNVWYLQDDYFTLDWGGAGSVWEAAGKMTSNLYHMVNRYQPVRLFLFTLATHWVPEEYSFRYNFSLHLINISFLFLLIRAFKVREETAFLATALFSVYGVFTMMESPGAMIGGSGLNAFFTLATLLFLFKGLTSPSRGWKFIHLAFSYLSYLGLIFSYEVAFPMLATVVCAFLFFDRFLQDRPVLSSPKGYGVLVPYLLFLAIYYFLFRSHPSSYEGAQINVSLDILTRFLAYSAALLRPFYHFDLPPQPGIILGLVLYYLGFFWVGRITKANHPGKAEVIGGWRNDGLLFLFGGVWYISSVSLFTLNNWISPTAVMHHHLYLMTVGMAMMIPSLFLMASHLFTSPVKIILQGFIIYILLPFLLISSINFHWHYGQTSAGKTKVLLGLKKQIQTYIPDAQKVDALILKNFLKPQSLHEYQISHMNGALLQWFNFKKYIESGDEILSAKAGKITFKGPLSYYGHIHHTKTLTVPNPKIEILYYSSDTKTLLPYGESIDFEKGINLHQTRQVRSNNEWETDGSYLEAILRNPGAPRFLTLSFRPAIDPLAIVNFVVIGINEMPVNEAYVSRQAISIDVSRFAVENKYLFLYLDLPDQSGFWQNLTNIHFANSCKGVKRLIPQSANFDFLNAPFSYHIGDSIRFNGEGAVEFINWYDAELTHRWAKGGNGSIAMRLGNLNPAAKQYVLNLKGFTLGKQTVEMRLNNMLISTFADDGSKKTWKIPFEAKLLKPNAVNMIEFRIPGARKPGGRDERILGFALQGLLLTSKSNAQTKKFDFMKPLEKMRNVGFVADMLGTRYKADLKDGIDFKKNGFPEFIKDISGLSGWEPWGRWTDSAKDKKFRVVFLDKLPEDFTLVLKAMAFGPNVGQPVEVSVGHQKKTFLLTQIMSEYRLSFHNYERSNEIIFFIPKPTSPAELGLSGDTRKLGIGFEKLSIEKKS
jgi:hypothetical protein